MFKQVKGIVGESKPPQSNLELLNWMEKLGLAGTIEANGATFYLLELGASPQSEVDPLELMMAYEPAGVVCYFSALAFHSLTSQMPSHHHVAVRTESSRRDSGREGVRENPEEGVPPEPVAKNPSRDEQTAKSKANALGKLLFCYGDVPYYLTRRTKRLVPGVQNRSHGPRCRFRITTYEQTLLDTLYKPQNCGGPAVVLEAWREATASGRLDEERLVSYLVQMDYPASTRRLGTMLQLMNYTAGDELGSCLDRAKRSLDRDAPYSQISLLPGFGYAHLDEEWLVRLP